MKQDEKIMKKISSYTYDGFFKKLMEDEKNRNIFCQKALDCIGEKLQHTILRDSVLAPESKNSKK